MELVNLSRRSPILRQRDDRLKLAEGSPLGELDAALDECRLALKLESHNAKAYLQLGVTLMAKQDGHAAAIALMEAILLDPELTHAHYSLGSAQYSLGNLTAAIQSYRRALDLQPNFPDARYRLALLLKLTNRHKEAAQFMEEAAIGGVPQAQYFMGNAYRNGQGVEKDLALAIRWWTNAVGFGQQRAAESLSQLRRQALSPDQSERRRKTRSRPSDSIARTLDCLPGYRENRPDQSLGLPCSKTAKPPTESQFYLPKPLHSVRLRTTNWHSSMKPALDTSLAQFDRRIRACFETTAADGFIPSKKALARHLCKASVSRRFTESQSR